VRHPRRHARVTETANAATLAAGTVAVDVRRRQFSHAVSVEPGGCTALRVLLIDWLALVVKFEDVGEDRDADALSGASQKTVMRAGRLSLACQSVSALGSSAHRAIIEEVVARYRDDDRVRAVAVFGSVATGAWHELSDIDVDVVIGEDVVVRPADEVAALFGPRAGPGPTSSSFWMPWCEMPSELASRLRAAAAGRPPPPSSECAGRYWSCVAGETRSSLTRPIPPVRSLPCSPRRRQVTI
jgi:Nucleotidyltransferase domain